MKREHNKALDDLRAELVEDLREHWAHDDRWAYWGRDNRFADWRVDWEDIRSRRLDRINHNDLAREHIRCIRALDAVRALAAIAREPAGLCHSQADSGTYCTRRYGHRGRHVAAGVWWS